MGVFLRDLRSRNPGRGCYQFETLLNWWLSWLKFS